MEKNYLIIGSVTQAILARDVLRRRGYAATTAKTPSAAGKSGCSYSVVIQGNPRQAIELLAMANIKVTGLYKGRSR